MQSIFNMGRIQNYGKMLQAKNLWESRKQTGYYEKMREKDPNRASVQEQIDQMNSNQNDPELEGIKTKLLNGQKLNYYEKEKLRTTDPELHKKAEEVETEQRNYEEKLKRCKTKDEVQRLKMGKLNAAINTVNTVDNNPNISLGKKLEIAEQESAKLRAVNQAEARFVKSGAYHKLSTEQEIQFEREKERKDLEEAQRHIAAQTQTQKVKELEKPQAPKEQPESTQEQAQPEKLLDNKAEKKLAPEKDRVNTPPAVKAAPAPLPHTKKAVESYKATAKHMETASATDRPSLNLDIVDLTRLIKKKRK